MMDPSSHLCPQLNGAKQLNYAAEQVIIHLSTGSDVLEGCNSIIK